MVDPFGIVRENGDAPDVVKILMVDWNGSMGGVFDFREGFAERERIVDRFDDGARNHDFRCGYVVEFDDSAEKFTGWRGGRSVFDGCCQRRIDLRLREHAPMGVSRDEKAPLDGVDDALENPQEGAHEASRDVQRPCRETGNDDRLPVRHALGRQFSEDHDERRDDGDVEQNGRKFLRLMFLRGRPVDGFYDHCGDPVRKDGAQQRQQRVDEHVADQYGCDKMLLVFQQPENERLRAVAVFHPLDLRLGQ